jgi:hypothetical protein
MGTMDLSTTADLALVVIPAEAGIPSRGADAWRLRHRCMASARRPDIVVASNGS